MIYICKIINDPNVEALCRGNCDSGKEKQSSLHLVEATGEVRPAPMYSPFIGEDKRDNM